MGKSFNKLAKALMTVAALSLAFPVPHARAERRINPALLASLFGRDPRILFGSRGLLNNLSLQNINFNNFGASIFPIDVAGFARIAVDPRNNQRFFLKNRSGLVTHEIFNAGGTILAAVTDFLGNRRSGFFPLRDAQGFAEASRFFLGNEDLIDPAKVGAGRAFVNFIRNRQLASTLLGPQGSRGEIEVDCAGVTGKSVPNQAIAEAKSDNKEVYDNLSEMDACKRTLLMALNSVKNPFSRTITEANLSVLPNGIIKVTGLLNHFLPEDLALLFSRLDNPRHCNNDPTNITPRWNIGDISNQVMDQEKYATLRKVDKNDVNRNFIVQFGKDLNIPRQLQGFVNLFGSQPPTNSFIIQAQQKSGVAESKGDRVVNVWRGLQNRGLYATFDTNYGVGGKIANADQDAGAVGAASVATRQGEYWGLAQDDVPTWILAAAPDEKGLRKRAAEAPGTAAHGPGGNPAVAGQNCIACHTCLAGLFSDKSPGYRDEGHKGTNGISTFSNGPIQTDLARWTKARTDGGYNTPDKRGCQVPLTYDASVLAKLPKTPEQVDYELRQPYGTVRAMINSNPDYWNSALRLDKDGLIDAVRFNAGGYCAVRDALAANPQFAAGGNRQPPPQNAGTGAQNHEAGKGG